VAKYHINPETGNPGVCKATKRCRFGDLETDHYTSKEAASAAYEEKMNTFGSPAEAIDPIALTAKLKEQLVRPQSIDFDTIERELGWINDWEQPWTDEEIENMATIEKLANLLDREPLTKQDEGKAHDLVFNMHPTVVPQSRRSGWSSSDPDADNWRARDKMIHELGKHMIMRRLGDELSYEPVEEVENPRLLGLDDAQEKVFKSYNRPNYDFQPEPNLGDVEPFYKEAIARVIRGDEAAPENILPGTMGRSLISPAERIFNTMHPDSELYDQKLYLSAVYPLNELKTEMDRVGIENVSVSPLVNGREWGNIYTVMTPDGGTRSFAVYEHRNSDSIIINGKDNWDGEGLPYAGDSKRKFFAEFHPDDRKRSAQALTFYMMQAQSGVLESDEELAAKVSRRDWNAILDASVPGFKEWRQEKITDRYIAPEDASDEEKLRQLDF
jgi:hypothetical protein